MVLGGLEVWWPTCFGQRSHHSPSLAFWRPSSKLCHNWLCRNWLCLQWAASYLWASVYWYALDSVHAAVQASLYGTLPTNCAIVGYAITGYAIEGAPLIFAHLSTKIFVYRYALDSAHATVQALLYGTLPTNCAIVGYAITGYAIEGAPLISAHLSTKIFVYRYALDNAYATVQASLSVP